MKNNYNLRVRNCTNGMPDTAHGTLNAERGTLNAAHCMLHARRYNLQSAICSLQSALCILLLLAVWPSQSVVAQEFVPVEESRVKQLTDEITRTSRNIQTLACDFTEEKQVSVLAEKGISQGKLYYAREDKIRWEYLTPTPYSLIANSENIVLRREEKEERTGGAVRGFREICNIILKSISGDQLVDEEKFTATYAESPDGYFRISMVPKNRKMRQFINEMSMIFTISNSEIYSVEMKQGDDFTRIIFRNKKTNEELDPGLFMAQTDCSVQQPACRR